MLKTIPYGRQIISDEDIEAVVAVLRSDYLTQGPEVARFEKSVAEYCGAKYAVAVNSATSALHIACLAAGLGDEDIFWTSPNTFVASANCGLYCGARVDFVDIDQDTYNLSPDQLELKLMAASRDGRLPKVLIPVHFSGQSCSMNRISEMSKEYRVTVIEDASHAVGGRYEGRRIGACTYSDMTVFSFHPVKIITTAEGGMVLTNSGNLYEKLVRLRSHGITRNTAFMRAPSPDPWYYEQLELGFNYRMNDIEAALGTSQLKRLDEFVTRRRAIAARYNEALKGLPVVLPVEHPDAYSSFHLYVVRLELDSLKKSRRTIFEELRAAGIGVNVHYIPVHTQPYYRQFGFKRGDFPNAEQYYLETLSLPEYPGLTGDDQDYVIRKLVEILK